jgi:tRNA(Ile)-lysidine synthase
MHLLSSRRGWGLSLHVAHVHHRVRGASADRDEQFTHALADTLHLPYHRLDLPTPVAGEPNSEARMRRLRYAALASCAASLYAEAVVTAHHADDQLETLLMRLMRGASIAGLRSMRWRRRLCETAPRLALLRPMLRVDRAIVLSFLSQLGQPCEHDETNEDVTLRRNRLRRDVLPVLQELAPHLPRNLSRLSDHLRDVDSLVRREAEGLSLPMPRDRARVLNRAVLMQVLREELMRAGVPSDRATSGALEPVVRAVRDHVGGERRFMLVRATVCVTRDQIHLLQEPRTQ